MSVHPEQTAAPRSRGAQLVPCSGAEAGGERPRAPRRPRDPSSVPVALTRAIVAAVEELESADLRDAAVGRDVDRRLREAVGPHLSRTGRTGRVVALVRIACAQLAIGDTELGLPALRDARDLLR